MGKGNARKGSKTLQGKRVRLRNYTMNPDDNLEIEIYRHCIQYLGKNLLKELHGVIYKAHG